MLLRVVTLSEVYLKKSHYMWVIYDKNVVSWKFCLIFLFLKIIVLRKILIFKWCLFHSAIAFLKKERLSKEKELTLSKELMLCKSTDLFLYDKDLRHKRVNIETLLVFLGCLLSKDLVIH